MTRTPRRESSWFPRRKVLDTVQLMCFQRSLERVSRSPTFLDISISPRCRYRHEITECKCKYFTKCERCTRRERRSRKSLPFAHYSHWPNFFYLIVIIAPSDGLKNTQTAASENICCNSSKMEMFKKGLTLSRREAGRGDSCRQWTIRSASDTK